MKDTETTQKRRMNDTTHHHKIDEKMRKAKGSLPTAVSMHCGIKRLRPRANHVNKTNNRERLHWIQVSICNDMAASILRRNP